MKRFFLSVLIPVLMLALQHSPVLAQATIDGSIVRVTQNGLQLQNGMSYRWADDVRTTLSNGNDGGWADLQANDAVRLTMNQQNRVASLAVTGRNTGQRIERSLTELKPVEGNWEVQQNVTIEGRVFEAAGTMNVAKNFNPRTITQRIVFLILEATICWRFGLGSVAVGGKGKTDSEFEVMEIRYSHPSGWNKETNPI